MNLTSSQEKAIKTKNKSLLVSAGAGSGKTHVLISRIEEILISGEACLSELLVVTFTKAAAAEMRSRLLSGLSKENSVAVSEIDTADIGTLHSFCSKFLRTHFYEVGLDPAFTLMDETESLALKNSCLEKLYQQKTRAQDSIFFELLDIFSQNRKDKTFRETVFKLQEFLHSLESPEDWKNQINSLYLKDLSKNPAINLLNQYIHEGANHLRKQVNNLVLLCEKEKAARLIEVLNEIDMHLIRFRSTNTFRENQKITQDFEIKSRILKREGIEELCEEVAALKDETKKFFEKASELLGFENENEIIQNLSSSLRLSQNLLSFVEDFDKLYAEEKSKLSTLDFSDLEIKTMKALENKALQTSVREKYKFVFVDEYQDVSPVQEKIIQLISKPNNLFVVGDVKQSIYGFRLSEPQNFLSRENLYEKNSSAGENIYLNENFRSHQNILNFVNHVFSKIMTPDFGGVNYSKNSMLQKGGNPFPEKPRPSMLPEVQVNIIKKAVKDKDKSTTSQNLPLYSVMNHLQPEETDQKSATAEGKILLERLKSLFSEQIYDAKLNLFRPVESKDIAIISLSRGEYMKTIINVLADAGFSCSSDIESDLFEDADMMLLKNLLMLINNPMQDIPLVSVMHSCFFNFTPDELAKIRTAFPSENFYYEAVNQFLKQKTDKKIAEKIEKMQKTLSRFQYLCGFLSVHEIILEIIKQTDFNDYLALQPNGKEKLARLKMLISCLQGKDFNVSLPRFLKTAEDIGFTFQNNEIQPVSGQAIATETDALRTFQQIRITSIHKSKGLEFPIVFLVGAGRPFNREDLSGDILISKTLGLGLSTFNSLSRTKTNNIAKNACRITITKKRLEEEMRLLYVALTRAVNHLFIIGVGDPLAPKNSKKSVQNASSFFDFLQPALKEKIGFQIKLYSVEMLAGKNDIVPAENVTFGGENSKKVKEIQENINFVYPYTESFGLAKKYSVSEILHINEEHPMTKKLFQTSTVEKGNAYHTLMQHIDFSKINDVEGEIKRLASAEILSADEVELIDKSQVEKCLNNPFFKVLSSGKRKIFREQQFVMMVPACEVDISKSKDPVLVQGVVDLCVVDKQGLVILDYKTDAVSSSEELKRKYKRQLELYARAMEACLNQPVVHKVIYSFHLNELIKITF